jgi:hypothetical protein
VTPTTNPDLEALQGLLESEGWRLLTDWVDSEWGAVGFAAKVSQTLGDPNMDPKLAVTQLQQATVAQKAVLGAMTWPVQRINVLKRQQQPQEMSMSRRGPGL